MNDLMHVSDAIAELDMDLVEDRTEWTIFDLYQQVGAFHKECAVGVQVDSVARGYLVEVWFDLPSSLRLSCAVGDLSYSGNRWVELQPEWVRPSGKSDFEIAKAYMQNTSTAELAVLVETDHGRKFIMFPDGDSVLGWTPSHLIYEAIKIWLARGELRLGELSRQRYDQTGG